MFTDEEWRALGGKVNRLWCAGVDDPGINRSACNTEGWPAHIELHLTRQAAEDARKATDAIMNDGLGRVWRVDLLYVGGPSAGAAIAADWILRQLGAAAANALIDKYEGWVLRSKRMGRLARDNPGLSRAAARFIFDRVDQSPTSFPDDDD